MDWEQTIQGEKIETLIEFISKYGKLFDELGKINQLLHKRISFLEEKLLQILSGDDYSDNGSDDGNLKDEVSELIKSYCGKLNKHKLN